MLQATGRMGLAQQVMKDRADRVAKHTQNRADHKSMVAKVMSQKKSTKTFDPTC